jgi:xanthine dehydrogenase molybdopterin-binding subunit B
LIRRPGAGHCCLMVNETQRAVGRNVARKDGIGKATGQAIYADDLVFPGMIWGRTIRADIPCGRIRDIRREFDETGFTVVDHRDIPGRNVIALIELDQPCLVEREIRHFAEPILLLAHEDRERLHAARVAIEYDRAAAVLDAEQSNVVFKHIHIEKGDVDAAIASADLIVEGTYRTGAQEHVYIEPNGVVAVPEEGGIAVHGSIQCPYYVHKALVALLGDAVSHVRVVQTETGGGFGGKEEFPSVIAAHAALGAAPGEDHLRSHRGHDRDDEAASFDRAAPDRRRARRTSRRNGHRRDARRRRVRDPQPRRAVSRYDSRRRAIQVRQHAHQRPGGHDEHAAQRGVSRVRRTANAVRDGGPHGPDRRVVRHGPGAAARAERAAGG